VALVAVGVDGARIGGRAVWVGVRLEDGGLREVGAEPTLQELLASQGDAAAIGVDIPVGHEDPLGADARQRGVRQADAAARQFLGPRRASIFHAPPPLLLEQPSHAAAIALARSKGWEAPSAQAWALAPRIREARAAAALDARIVEVHPECSFQALKQALGGQGPLEHPKAGWNGLFERLTLLHRGGLRPARSYGGIGRAGPDDVLDATAAAWSAQRVALGQALSLPGAPRPLDPATGREVAIWA
jgi:predicted RNase H-like nuclease